MTVVGAIIALVLALIFIFDDTPDLDFLSWAVVAVSAGIVIDAVVARTRTP